MDQLRRLGQWKATNWNENRLDLGRVHLVEDLGFWLGLLSHYFVVFSLH